MSCPHGVDTYIHRCGACDTIGAIHNSGPDFVQRVYERAVAYGISKGGVSRDHCRKYIEDAELAARVLDEFITASRDR